jgi:hypothetical protein
MESNYLAKGITFFQHIINKVENFPLGSLQKLTTFELTNERETNGHIKPHFIITDV